MSEATPAAEVTDLVRFAGRHNIRELDTIDQMRHVVAGLVVWWLLYKDLVGE